jgi:hypothetical protein
VGIRRIVGAAVIAICVIVPAIETIDTWDHTLRDGNDTEMNVVVAAICVGLTLTIAASIVTALLRSIPRSGRVLRGWARATALVGRTLAAPLPTSNPPPLPLRI